MSEHPFAEYARLLSPLVIHASFLKSHGFVWVGDMEQDPRRAGGSRVAWARKPNNDLYVLDLAADSSWEPISDEQWDNCYPYAGHPPYLPVDYVEKTT